MTVLWKSRRAIAGSTTPFAWASVFGFDGVVVVRKSRRLRQVPAMAERVVAVVPVMW